MSKFMSERKRPRRRWTQVSLRSFLLLSTLAGVGFSLYYGRDRNVPMECFVFENRAPPVWIKPPQDAEILRKFLEQHPEHVSKPGRILIMKEKLVDQLEPAPKYFSPFGRARLHRVKFRCTLYARSLAGGQAQEIGEVIIVRDHFHTERGELANIAKRFPH